MVSFKTGGNKVKLWDIQKGIVQKTLVTGTTTGASKFSSNMKFVACNAADIKLYLYNIDSISSTEPTNEIQATISYPNPSTTELVLEFTLIQPNNTTITINDLSGKQIKEVLSGYMNVGNHKLHIDLRELYSGTYFLNVLSGNQVITEKVVVEKYGDSNKIYMQ